MNALCILCKVSGFELHVHRTLLYFSIISARVFLFIFSVYLCSCILASFGSLEERNRIQLNIWNLAKAKLSLWRPWSGFQMIFFSFSPAFFSIVRPLQSARSHSALHHQKLCGGRGNLRFGSRNKHPIHWSVE